MNAFRILVALCVTLLLGACAGTIKMLPDEKHCVSSTTVGDTLDRSSTYVVLNECYKDGDRLVVGKEVKPGDLVHGQTVGGQAIVGAVAGVGAAATNGLFGRSIAKIGQCAAGALCDATIINNSVQSAAQALVDNKSIVKVGMPPTVGLPSCAKSNTCGD